MNDAAVRDLALRAGIAVDWHDIAGRQRSVAPDILRLVLEALGLPCATAADVAASHSLLAGKPGLAGLPPLITTTAGQPARLGIEADAAMPAQLKLEAGGSRPLTLFPEQGRLHLPAVAEAGYHRLLLGGQEIVLAVAPDRCRTLGDVAAESRLWGLAVQVYALRQPGDGGIGDAAGIAALAEAAGRRGADALALSPLHALFSADPGRFGPYSPSSRLFLNPLHAAPGLVFGSERVAAAMARAGLGETFSRLEALPLIDWKTAAQAKLALLRGLFEALLAAPGDMQTLAADFSRFRADRGETLARHALFEALHAEHAGVGQYDWRDWPADLRDPASPAVAAFAGSRGRAVLFHQFLQWLADRSLAAAQAAARRAGMRIGLIADLAVGMDPAGSHAWSRAGDLLGGLSIGAPPDMFNPRGQDWGLTGFSPRALAADGYGPFLATLRATLRNTGGVRIDHAMGLTRLWLIPRGAAPADGAYLAYPMTDLLRLLALESQRHQAIVVGEDLGTVPGGFRERLAQAGVHGMRVLWFERHDHGFAAPQAWDRGAVAMTSTHDLPTVAGWWHGSDIATRAASGRPNPNEHETAERAADRAALWQAMVREAVAEGEAPAPADVQPAVDAAVRFIARTASPLCLLPIEDVLGQEEQPNLPGTVDEYPNWRRRLPRAADRILDEPNVAARLERLAAERPRR